MIHKKYKFAKKMIKLEEPIKKIIVQTGYAGYKQLVTENKIVNVHPSLLPKFGGKGMYGIKIHEAVLAAGEKKTGVTIHKVQEEYDQGEILAQVEIQIRENDTPCSLRDRVLLVEHNLYVETLRKISLGNSKT